MSSFGCCSLEELCLQACSQLFSALPTQNNKNLEIIHDYLQFAAPFIPRIGQRCYYHYSSNKTLMFIPYLLQGGTLSLTDENITQVASWIDSPSNFNRKYSSCLKKVIMNAPKAENYFAFLPLVPKLSFITWLELTSWTTDDVFSAIGMHCTKLEILDARADGETAITDVGLGFLCRCKTLKKVLLSNFADEYDYESKFRFTGKGMALLMLSLPNLDRVECPEYLLRDALQYIYQMSFHQIAHIKYLYLASQEVPAQTFSILPFLCPYIHTLSVFIHNGTESMFCYALKRLLCLKKLKIKFEGWCNASALNLTDYESLIEYLIIDSQYMRENDLYRLTVIFPRLRTLVIAVHSFGFIPDSSSQGCISNLNMFSHLNTIQFDQRVSGKLFKCICLCVKHLKALYCQRAMIYDVENSIDFIISKGGWMELEILSLPQNFEFSCNFLIKKLTKLKNLKFVAVEFPNEAEENLFITLLAQKGSKIKLCTFKDIRRPSKQFTDL